MQLVRVVSIVKNPILSQQFKPPYYGWKRLTEASEIMERKTRS